MSIELALTAVEERLAQRARLLQQRLAAAEAGIEPVGHEVGDRKDEAAAEMRATVGDAERERDLAELREIAAARARVADGSYGVCVDCGSPVGDQRLAARPAAARCIHCQQVVERHGVSSRW